MQEDGFTFQVTAKGVWCYQWADANKRAMLNKIRGKSVKDAQAILDKYVGVGNAKIDVGNGGTTLPNDVGQIRLVVNTVKGL